MKYKCPSCGCIFTGPRESCPYCGCKFKVNKSTNVNKAPANVKPSNQVVKSEQPKPSEKAVQINPEQKVEEPKIQYKEKVVYVSTIDQNAKSYFDGNTIQYIGIKILAFLLSVITLFIATPAGVAMVAKWEAKHTVLNGYREKFVGSVAGFIGRWFGWMLLSIITAGIFALTLPVRLQKWKASKTILIPDPKAR